MAKRWQSPYVRIVVAFFISDNWSGLDKTMPRYTIERKDAVLVKLLPPYNRPISEVAQSEGITEATLYNWLKQAKKEGHLVPGRGKASSESWDGQTKFAVVLETAAMNASELSEYCRSKGLFPEQIARWKKACIVGVGAAEQTEAEPLKQSRKQINQLEKELRRKDKALAEAAALLVLQKKFNALWEDEEA